MIKYIFLPIFLITVCFGFKSQIVISNTNATVETLLGAMVGGGLTVTNPTISCGNNAYGSFTNGSTTNLGIGSGVILSTGNLNTLNGPVNQNWSTPLGANCNNPLLTNLEPLATRDCCILEFDVVPTCSTLTIRFVFGSEEYPEFVNAGYNDAFGFFVTGPNPSGAAYNNTNVATLPNNSTIVTIDNVNANNNNTFYVTNTGNTSTKLDAFTTVLTRDISVVPCQTYRFVLAIADAGDGAFDSAVFIDFLDCTTSLDVVASTTPATCAGNDGTAGVTASNGVPPYTYTWDTNPVQTTATITGLEPGTYTVTVDDDGPCTLPVVQTITVLDDESAPALSVNSPVLCIGSSGTLTATTGGGGTYLWSTGETTESIVVSPSETTVYSVTYDVGVCFSVRTVTVVVTTEVLPTFTQIGQQCQYRTAPILLNQSTNQPSIQGTWNPPVIDTQTPGVQTYTFTPNADQCAFSTTMDVEVIPEIETVFFPIDSLCAGVPSFNLPSSSSNTPTIFGTWNLNQVITTSPGSFDYIFTPITSECASRDTLTIVIKPVPTVTTETSQVICQGQNALFVANVSIPGGEFIWSPDGQTTDSIIVSPNNTTTYTVTYTLNGCTGNPASGVLTVNPNIPVDAGADNAICIGDSIVLFASGTPIIEWQGGYTNNQVLFPEITTTYTVLGTSDNGCITQDSRVVTVNPLPIINPGPDQTICTGYPVVLEASGAGDGATYIWTNLVQNGVTFNPTSTNTYTVTGLDANGCINTASVTVTTLPLPIASFTASPMSGYSPLNVSFTNNSSNANSYYWDFGNGQNVTVTTKASQQMTYITEQPYDAWLYASNGYCSDSATIRIDVLFMPDVWAPNVFSPNDDDVNSYFNINTENVASLNLQIFNRWGNLIAEINTITGGWNGKSQSGANATEGVYFYKYKAIGVNGEELEGHGFLTLVR